MRPYCVQEIANYIIWDSHEAGSFLNPSKLQKLLYLAQARHLAMHDAPLFRGRFEAWLHGPVLRSIHKRFEHYGWRSLDEFAPKPEIDDASVRFLATIMEEYGACDARRLEALIRRDSAYAKAREGAVDSIDGRWEVLVDEEGMKRAYRRAPQPDDVPEGAFA